MYLEAVVFGVAREALVPVLDVLLDANQELLVGWLAQSLIAVDVRVKEVRHVLFSKALQVAEQRVAAPEVQNRAGPFRSASYPDDFTLRLRCSMMQKRAINESLVIRKISLAWELELNNDYAVQVR